MKVIINKCHGGFGFSQQAFKLLIANGWKVSNADKSWKPIDDPLAPILTVDYKNETQYVFNSDLKLNIRTNPDIVAVVEKLGKHASGEFSDLKIVEIPDDVEWVVDDYDGVEWVAEKHRTWS